MYAYASSIHSFQRRISEHQKKRWQEEQKLAAWSGPTSEILYTGITAKRVDEQSIHLVIAVRDAVYPLDFLEHRFHIPGKNLDANITDFILEQLRNYSLDHAEKFIGTCLPTELTEMCPRLASRLWLELDVMPLVVPQHDALGGRYEQEIPWETRDADEQAEYLAMKCVRLFGPNNIPLLQVGFRGLVEVDSGFMMHLATLDDYKGTVSERTWMALERLAAQVREQRIRIALFSATPQGGGVALIRHAFLRLSKLLNLDVQWYVPQPRSGVFRITKMNHNIFQGVAKPNDYLTAENEEQLRRWVSVNSKRSWSCLGGPLDHPSNGGAHIVVVDDPQLPDLIPIAKEKAPERPVIFRSHIQIRVDLACTPGTPQARSWDWLWQRAQHADVFISHPIPDSVPTTVPNAMIGHSPASTDVLDGLNKGMIDSDVAYYGRLFNQWCHESGMPTIDYPTDEYFVQIARFDLSKGIIDVLDSYHKFHTRLTKAKPDSKIPKLVICGHGSVDDPDASEMFDKAMDHIHKAMPHLADKITVVRAKPSDQVLNAVLSKSKVVLQLSTQEGFEIKVSEALRKGKPVIVTDVGGLPYQVIDTETGFIVKARDTDRVAECLYHLWTDADLYRRMQEKAPSSVSDNVTTVGLVSSWLYMIRKLLEDHSWKPGNRLLFDLMFEDLGLASTHT
ncbi:trehalose phosphorylase [Aspergillus udagawae]|nr:trehalose phosphorylase [Aspergillus udagawae]